MDINDEIEVEVASESREEISHELNVASTSKPQTDEIRMDTLMDDNTDNYSYVDSDEDDPVLKSRLKSLKKQYKGGSNGSQASKSNISESFNLAKIREGIRLAREKLPKSGKQNLINESQSPHRPNLDSREKRSPKKKYRTVDNDDGVGSSRKKQSPKSSTAGRKNEFESINFSSDDEGAKGTNQYSRRKSLGSFSDDEELKNFRFSDDERNAKRHSFHKPDGNSSDDEFFTISKSKKFKSNSFKFIEDQREESADEDYVPAISIDNNEDKAKDRRESSYLDTEDDDFDEVLSNEKNISPEDSLPKSVSAEKASESLIDVDGGTSGKFDKSVLESILDDNASLDDYVAVDKPRSSPKQKRQQRQIIIHEESSSITELQPPFQPGSSPMKNGRRYLATNWLGCIHAVDNTVYHSVNVEYNNKTQYKGYNFRDEMCYTMACLGAHGVLFAVESEAENPSILYYKPNNSWSLKGEWMMSLPMGEDVIAIALSDQTIVAATSKNYLRFFTPFGVQNYIFAFPSIVCMTAYSNLLLVAYHLSVAHKGSQNLGYILYDMHDRGDIQKDVLPISKGSTLKWLGFSEEGLPAMFDSKGVLYILHDHRIYKQARWVPVLDTVNIVKEVDGKSKSSKKDLDVIDLDDISGDKGEKDEEKEIEEREKEKEKEWLYWPVAVMESKLMCFILKYGEDVPRYPRPAYDEVNWQLPLMNLNSEGGRYEERLMRESIISSFQCQEAKAKNELNEENIIRLKKKEKDANKIIIKLIMIAASEGKYERALDLAKLLNSVKLLEYALKIAEFNRAPSLSEKINKLKSEKIREKERLISRRQERQSALSSRTTSSSRPSASTDNYVYVSDINYNYNMNGSSQCEERQISPLKRSVKDMNDGGEQEEEDDSPKAKKTAAPISSYFPKKSTLAAKSGCSNPSVVDNEKPAASRKKRAPKKQMKGKNKKNNENEYSQDQDQENEAGHSSEQNEREEHERTNDEISENHLIDNRKSELDTSNETETSIGIEISKKNIKEVNEELIIDNSVEESNDMDIDVEKETIDCFD